jgi:hydroxypyruvate isomerase
MHASRRSFLGAAAAVAAGGTAFAADEAAPLAAAKKTKYAANLEMWWTKLPFLKRIEAAAKMGFPAFEFWPWQNKDIAAIAEACAKHKIVVAQFTGWGFKPGLNEPSNHNKFVETIEAGCETAKKLKCKMMCVVAGDDVPGMTQAQMHENVIIGLKKAVPVVEKHDVTLILEPMNVRVDHKGHCLYGSAPAARIIKAVGSKNVRMLYDAYHMHITEGDLCGHLKEFWDTIAYVQIADHPGRTEPGTGEIHYPRVFRQLQELGYQGYVGVECRPLKTEAEAAARLAQADQW